MDSLPAELLLKVLDELEEDPRDLLNASESFGSFDDLLGGKVDTCRLEEVLPLVLKWLKVKDILACRRTCKRIQGSVDIILDNVEQLSKYRNLELIRSRFNPPQIPRSFEWDKFLHLHSKLGVALDSLQKITRFQEEMEGSLESGHPFIAKRLSMTKNTNRERIYCRDLLEAGIQLMTQFQSKLAHVNLNVGMLDTSAIETYGLLRRVFLAVPNLQTFRANMRDQWNPDHLDDLSEFIAQHPLPVMPLLKRISFQTYRVATPIYQEMVNKYCDRLESLQYYFWNHSLREHPEYLSLDGVQRFHGLVEMGFCMSWRMRDLLLKMEAPSLVHLKLGLLFTFELPTPPPMPMLQFIQIFKSFPNLVDLELKLFLLQSGVLPFGWNEQRQAFRDRLSNRHPNLKNLKLSVYVSLTHFPLRLWLDLFPNLKHLWINVIGSSSGIEPHPDHDLNLFVGDRGYESRLWWMGPSLQRVQIIQRFRSVNLVYTRTGYERERLQQRQQSSSTLM